MKIWKLDAINHDLSQLSKPFCIIVVCGILYPLAVPVKVWGESAPTTCAYSYSQQTMFIEGYSTVIELYRPIGSARFPLVYMLHGSAGVYTLKAATEPLIDNFGEKTLARNCFTVALPHYLEAIGRKSLTSREEIAAHFPEMLAVTELLLAREEALPAMRGSPVLILGESLGAYLSIALAFRRTEVEAVSEVSGGRPEGYTLTRGHGLRVLISHGDSDTLVLPSEAENLILYCSAQGIPATMDIYPGETHYLSQPARAQVLSRTISFFRERIKMPGRRLKALARHGRG